jgi:hypothetical protein
MPVPPKENPKNPTHYDVYADKYGMKQAFWKQSVSERYRALTYLFSPDIS